MKKTKVSVIVAIVICVSVLAGVFAYVSRDTCNHSFVNYVSDNNASCFSDGTKTAACENGCGKKDTVTDNGTKITLDKPSEITSSQTTDSITLSWTEVKGATGYQVYCKTTGDYEKLGSTKETSYTMDGLTPGSKVSFSVKAYAKKAFKTVEGNGEATVFTAAKCELPEEITYKSTYSQIKLSWSESAGADGYRVYYKTANDWKVANASVKTNTATFKKLPAGKAVTFAVSPYVEADELVLGDYKEINTTTQLSKVPISVNFISKGKIAVSWKAASGAEEYQLYCNNGGDSYELYESYKTPQTVEFSLKEGYYGFYVRALKAFEDDYIYSEYNPTTVHLSETSAMIVSDPSQEPWNLVLVNKQREMPEDYQVKLADIPDGYQLDYRVAPYFNKMYKDAAKEGITLTPNSAYRSAEYQAEIFEEYTLEYMSSYDITREEAEDIVKTEVLMPGTSEHNLGYAIDICTVEDTFANSAEYQWLAENAHKYGFIERYTAEKQSITGIIPEPWHWRFVGVEYAEKIKNSGLCLEEYLEKYNLLP